MKKFILTIASLAVYLSTYAQQEQADILYLRDGTNIIGKILKEVPGYTVEIERGNMIEVYKSSDITRIERNTNQIYAPSYPSTDSPEPHSTRPYVSPPVFVSHATTTNYATGPTARTHHQNTQRVNDFYPQLESFPPAQEVSYSNTSVDYNYNYNQPQNASAQQDIINLRNGRQVSGTIADQNATISIWATDGQMHTYTLSEIYNITRASW